MPLSPLRRRLLAVIFIVFGLLVFALLVLSRPPQAPLSIAERSWRVSVQEVQLQTLAPQLILYGTLQSPQRATLSASIAADVLAVPAKEGMSVKQGDTLLLLDEREVRWQLSIREAELADIQAQIAAEQRRFTSEQTALRHEQNLLSLAERSLNRLQNLQRNDLSSRAAMEEAERAYEQQALAFNARRLVVDNFNQHLAQLEAKADRARALRDLARLDLERTRIVAPFDGIITEVLQAPGDRVRTGDAMLRLFAANTLEVRAIIPAQHIPVVRVALHQGIALDAAAISEGQPLALRLRALAGQAEPGGAGVEGLFELSAPHEGLALGRFVSLSLHLPPQSGVVALPFEAVYGKDLIYRLLDGRMRPLTVERLGEWRENPEASDARILVRHPDLQNGDWIITTRLPNALDGLSVNPVSVQ